MSCWKNIIHLYRAQIVIITFHMIYIGLWRLLMFGYYHCASNHPIAYAIPDSDARTPTSKWDFLSTSLEKSNKRTDFSLYSWLVWLYNVVFARSYNLVRVECLTLVLVECTKKGRSGCLILLTLQKLIIIFSFLIVL
jgi:hypothetical protein